MNGELQSQTRDGRKFIVDCRIMLVRDESGRPRAQLSFLADITEKKLLEEKFLHAQRLESIRFVAMSGAGSAPKAAASEFMSAFLAKPFQPGTLLPLIHRVLHEPAPPTAPHPAPADGAEPVTAARVP
jgi:DNA-binding NtrC family response regulator